MRIQLEQQIPHEFRVSWEFSILPAIVLQLWALEPSKPILSVKDTSKKSH